MTLSSGMRPVPVVPGVRHRLVHASGVTLHVAEAGDPSAAPVLLLHGFPQHWYAWRHVIPLLAGEYRLVCVDLRGFGWSDAPASGYDSASQVADVLALMDALGLRRASVIGHQGGGVLGFQLSLAAPERVSALLALNAVHPWPRQRLLLPRAWRFWYTAFLEYPGVGRRVLAHWPAFTAFLLRRGVADPAAWRDGDIAEFVAALREPARARAGEQVHWQFVLHDIPALALGRYRKARLMVPALILAGARDPVLRPAVLGGGERHADDLRVEVVPGAGQYLPAERPDLVAAAARRLFGRAGLSAPAAASAAASASAAAVSSSAAAAAASAAAVSSSSSSSSSAAPAADLVPATQAVRHNGADGVIPGD